MVCGSFPFEEHLLHIEEQKDKLMAFPSSSLLPHVFVFITRSLPPWSTNQILFVSCRLSGASKQVIEMRIMLRGTTDTTYLKQEK